MNVNRSAWSRPLQLLGRRLEAISPERCRIFSMMARYRREWLPTPEQENKWYAQAVGLPLVHRPTAGDLEFGPKGPGKLQAKERWKFGLCGLAEEATILFLEDWTRDAIKCLRLRPSDRLLRQMAFGDQPSIMQWQLVLHILAGRYPGPLLRTESTIFAPRRGVLYSVLMSTFCMDETEPGEFRGVEYVQVDESVGRGYFTVIKSDFVLASQQAIELLVGTAEPATLPTLDMEFSLLAMQMDVERRRASLPKEAIVKWWLNKSGVLSMQVRWREKKSEVAHINPGTKQQQLLLLLLNEPGHRVSPTRVARELYNINDLQNLLPDEITKYCKRIQSLVSEITKKRLRPAGFPDDIIAAPILGMREESTVELRALRVESRDP